MRALWRDERFHRYGSVVVALVLLVTGYFTAEGARTVLSVGIALIMPVAFIWWPDTFTDLNVKRPWREVDTEFWIRFSGWFFLLGVPLLMLLFCGRVVFEGYEFGSV